MIATDFPHFDAQTIASQGNAVLGIRDSGKSYTAVGFAERLYDAGIPFVAFDPIGRWRFLRVPGIGKGYPVVVAGGSAGDLPLTVESAPRIVRAAMESGVSLVIDLYDMEVSKADWKRIVADSVRVLLYGNGTHGLRHIFIEEAAEFCPQRVGPDQGRVYAEIEKLARMGGNARLGYTLINQRAEEVNKAVLELCDNLFLHRQKGRNSLNALTKWLDVADVRAGKEIVSSLPTLPQGECWAWMAGTDRPVRVKVPTKNSFEPDRRAMGRQDGAAQSKTVDVAQFVTALRASLSSPSDEKAKSDIPHKLVEKCPTHDAELAIAARNATKAGYESGFSEGREVGYRQGFHAGYAEATDAIIDYAGRLKADHPAAARIPQEQTQSTGFPKPASEVLPLRKLRGKYADTMQKPNGAAALDGSAVKLLQAFQKYPDRGLTWDEACIVASIIPGNGYFYAGKKKLIDGGYVEERNGRTFSTGATHPAVPLKRQDIVRQWSGKLKQPAGRMLEYLANHAHEVSVHELSGAIAAKPGNGYWYSGVAALRDANLIEDRKGALKLSAFLVEAK